MSDHPEARVARLIEEALGVVVADPELDLLASLLVDSLGLLSLIVELEEEFDCELPLDRLSVDDFRTVRCIAGVLTTVPVR